MGDEKLAINGQKVDGDMVLDVVNPATGEVFAQVPRASVSQANSAVAAAKAAFPSWARTLIAERKKLLVSVADKLNARAEEIARVMTQEQGKPLAESEFEVSYTEAFIRHFAGMDITSHVVQDDEAFHVEVRRKALGVVAAITPWNFPILIPGWCGECHR